LRLMAWKTEGGSSERIAARSETKSLKPPEKPFLHKKKAFKACLALLPSAGVVHVPIKMTNRGGLSERSKRNRQPR